MIATAGGLVVVEGALVVVVDAPVVVVEDEVVVEEVVVLDDVLVEVPGGGPLGTVVVVEVVVEPRGGGLVVLVASEDDVGEVVDDGRAGALDVVGVLEPDCGADDVGGPPPALPVATGVPGLVLAGLVVPEPVEGGGAGGEVVGVEVEVEVVEVVGTPRGEVVDVDDDPGDPGDPGEGAKACTCSSPDPPVLEYTGRPAFAPAPFTMLPSGATRWVVTVTRYPPTGAGTNPPRSVLVV